MVFDPLVIVSFAQSPPNPLSWHSMVPQSLCLLLRHNIGSSSSPSVLVQQGMSEGVLQSCSLKLGCGGPIRQVDQSSKNF